MQSSPGSTVAALKEVFSDPLLAGELPGDQELIEMAEAAPNAAAAMVKLFRAYREQADRLSDLSDLLAREGRATALSGARLPIDEVREIFERRPNHFAAIEEEAEAFTALLDPGDDLAGALKAWLKREFGIVVRVLPVATMPNWRRRYDRHSQRLFISERLSPFDQLREIAMEACLIRMRVAIAAEIEALKLSSDEARRLARFELARYAAHALMMPYQPFHAAAQRSGYDIDVLRSRFGVSFEQAANRLTTLGRPGSFRHSVLHAGDRQCRAPPPPRRRARFSARALRRRLPEAAGPCRLRAARADPGRGRRNARWRRVPVHCPHAGRPAGRLRRTAAAHRAADRLRYRLQGRDRLRRGAAGSRRREGGHGADRRRSVRPAGSASASAASPAPSRR